MLKKVPNPTFTVPVKARIPGGVTPIAVTYNYYTPKDWQTVLDGNPKMTIGEALEKVVHSWEGMEAPFSAAELADYKRCYPSLPDQLYATFLNEIGGGPLGN